MALRSAVRATTTAPVLTAKQYMMIFYPQYFNPASPSYVQPDIIDIALGIASEFVPPCLRESLQNIAQAHYAAYIIEGYQAANASGGGGGQIGRNSGIILSEREGDISVTYADPRTSGSGESSIPPQSAWEKWEKLHDLCKYGAITSRYGQQI